MTTMSRKAVLLLLAMILPACLPAQQKEATAMSMTASMGESSALTEAIRPRLLAMWEHYKNQEADAHNALLTDDYQAVFPDGSLHSRKPTAEEIARARMTAYTLEQVQAVPLGPDAALVTYFAEVEGPSGGKTIHVKYAVGNVWVKRQGKWLCRYYQGTEAK